MNRATLRQFVAALRRSRFHVGALVPSGRFVGGIMALALCGAVVVAQKKDDAEIQKTKVDPYTKGEADAMAKVGVLSYGPLVWADNLRTTDIERVLGEGRVHWLETKHFRIGSNLKTQAAPTDPKARKRLNAEMKRLNKKHSKLPARKGKLDPWLRLHLYAQRAEELYAEFAELIGYEDDSKHLGQKRKILLLLFHKRSDMSRYLDRFCGRQSEWSTRHTHHQTGHYSLVMTNERDDGTKDPNDLHAQFRYLLLQIFQDMAGGTPQWLSYGLAHHYERMIPSRIINVGVRADESVDQQSQHKWRDKVQGRIKHDELYIPFADLAKLTDFGYYAHIQSWSRVDYMLETDKAKFGEFVRAVLKSSKAKRQYDALAVTYEITPEEFDQKWRKWVAKNY